MRFSVAKNNWDAGKQIVKERSKTTDDGSVNVNELLKYMKELCLKTYNKELASGIPSKEALKKALDEYIYRNIRKVHKTTSQYSFFELIDKFIEGKMGDPRPRERSKLTRRQKCICLNFKKNKKSRSLLIR